MTLEVRGERREWNDGNQSTGRYSPGRLGSSLLAQVDTPAGGAPAAEDPPGAGGLRRAPEEILRVLPQLPDVELVAVADEESDPAAQASVLKNRYAAKARRYDTLDATAGRRARSTWWPSAINNGRRTAAILACAARKLNVIAEKPLALLARISTPCMPP